MTTVTKSAADSAVKLLSTVSISADAISTIVGAAGAAFGVLDVKAQSWLKASREETTDAETIRSATSMGAAARQLVDHFEDLDLYLAGNPKRKNAYEIALLSIEEARARAAA